MLTFIQTISIYAKNHFSSESSRYHKTIFVQTTKKKKKKKNIKKFFLKPKKKKKKKRYKKQKKSCDLSFQYPVNSICVKIKNTV